jgi:hypothetical protein
MGVKARILSVFLCVVLGVPALAIQKPKKSSHKSRAKQQPAQALPQLPSGPLQQMPLDSVPAVAPEVSYQDGNLTILAHNSNLTDILKAVQTHTGASIDVPSTATERVVTSLGPAPARDVLAKLLNGSHYNYVMLGSVDDPNAVSKIVLTSKATNAPESGPAPSEAAGLQPPPQPNQGMPQPAQVMPPPNPQAAAADGEEVEPEPEAEEGNDQAEEQDQDGAGGTAPAAPQAAPGQQGPKTPEQLLQELQRQQQLLQQQQQQQQGQQQGQPQPPPAVPNQPPQE